MRSWRKVVGGVEKTHCWGKSVVYAKNFEDCFSEEELLQIRDEFEKLGEVDLKVRVENRLRKRFLEVKGDGKRGHS